MDISKDVTEIKKQTNPTFSRSSSNKILGGVASGIARYFDVDANLVRFIFILLTLLGGSGMFIYILLWILMPAPANNDKVKESDRPSRQWFAVILIFLGLFFLMNNFGLLWWFSVRRLWPAILIVIGFYLLFKHENPQRGT